MKSSQWRMLVAQNIRAKREAELSAVNAPPKFCKDCAYHSCEFDKAKGNIRHHCSMPTLLNVVTGEKTHPASNRNSETLCGREARYFVPRRPVIDQRGGMALGLTTERMDADSRTEIGDLGDKAESETTGSNPVCEARQVRRESAEVNPTADTAFAAPPISRRRPRPNIPTAMEAAFAVVPRTNIES